MGVLKLSFALMLFSHDPNITLIGTAGIMVLMLAAVMTHVKAKNILYKMLLSISLIVLILIIFLYTY